MAGLRVLKAGSDADLSARWGFALCPSGIEPGHLSLHRRLTEEESRVSSDRVEAG
jgi:hypothetical protein